MSNLSSLCFLPTSSHKTFQRNPVMKKLKVRLNRIDVKVLCLLATIGYWSVAIPQASSFEQAPTSTADIDGTLKLEIKTFESKSMGKTRRFGVILPPQYQDDLKKRYPVIIMLHGGHGNERDWVEKFSLLPALDHLYKTKLLPPSIVVTPDGNDRRAFRLGAFDPNYYDGPNGEVGTLIGSELPSILKSQYRTLPNPELWAMGGLSSGGWGALNIGLHHLDQFNVFFSEIGYFTDKSGPQNSPLLLVQTLPMTQLQRLHVYADAGVDDAKNPSFLRSSRQFHEVLDRLHIDNVFYTFPGGHGSSGPNFGSNYFRKHAVDALSFVGKNFRTALKQQQ
jgi:enterochelin esterase-like enzyme